MGAREYDPALGRFTSADPIHGIANNPQTRNRYPYAVNNPLVMYDLDGRFPNPFSGAINWVEESAEDWWTGANMIYDDPLLFGEGAYDIFIAGTPEALENIYDFFIGDDINLLTSPNSHFAARLEGGAFLALNFVPGGKGAKCGKLLKGAKVVKGGSKFIPEQVSQDVRLFKRWLRTKSNVSEPLTHEEARELMEAGRNLGLSVRGPEVGQRGKVWKDVEHIHIGDQHIPVQPGFEP